jgi:thymidylate kinase
VDGVEGAGKTTLATALMEAVPACGISEFSSTAFGAALREAVLRAPHFISVSALGQSLVFLGDFVELYEAEIRPSLSKGMVVVSDRGWVSKYAYQMAVLETSMTSGEAHGVLLEILRRVQIPDLSICLTAPLPVIRERLIARDGHCDDGRSAFIVRAETALHRGIASVPELRHVYIPTDRPKQDVLNDALTEIRKVQ